MRLLHVVASGLLVGALLGLAGCQKLKVEKEFIIGPQGWQEVGVSGPTYNQKVEATLKANFPLNAYLVLDDNIPAVKEAVENRKPLAAGLALDSKENLAEPTLNGDIPAKKAFTVLMYSPSRALKGTVTILGK